MASEKIQLYSLATPNGMKVSIFRNILLDFVSTSMIYSVAFGSRNGEMHKFDLFICSK